jgi:glycosyltransferase involved in cell wall biosynthesis
MSKKSKSILFTGYKLGDPKKAGGFIVYTENILHDFRELGIEYDLLNTNTQFYKNLPHMFVVVIYQFFRKFRKFDHISLHGTANHFILLGPIFVFFGKMFGKTVSVKKTAGRFDREYEKLDFFRKKLVDYVLKNADIVYFETKFLVEHFKDFNEKTYWHPNIRRNPEYEFKDKPYQKKFAFISLIAEQKGMDVLLEASDKLDDSYTVDVYGKPFEEKYTKEYFEKHKANFKGALGPKEVLEKLQEYDVLVLPSFEEGYPGIFIEAYSYGVPVLTTTLPRIKEIVEEGKTGFLVEPGDVEGLYQGFLAFNEENYKQMSKNAYDAFSMFDSLKQTSKMVDDINKL